jgi:hypothetical protein
VVVIEFLLIDEDYYTCIEGREIISNHQRLQVWHTPCKQISTTLMTVTSTYVTQLLVRSLSLLQLLAFHPFFPSSKLWNDTQKAGVSEVVGRIVNKLNDEAKPNKKMEPLLKLWQLSEHPILMRG